MLYCGVFDQVAQVELFHVFAVLEYGIRNLGLRSIGNLHEGGGVIGTDECRGWVDAGVYSHGCD